MPLNFSAYCTISPVLSNFALNTWPQGQIKPWALFLDLKLFYLLAVLFHCIEEFYQDL